MGDLELASDVVRVVCDDVTVLGRLPDGPTWVLEGSAAQVVAEIDGGVSLSELVRRVASGYDVPGEEIERDVAEMVDAMRSAGIVVGG